MADITSEPDVLVAGGGPVGLMAAAELVRRGVTVRVVDAADGPATTSRALNVHARTLEMVDPLGLAGTLLARGRRADAFVQHLAGRPERRVPVSDQGRSTRFDLMLMLDQVVTEEVLRGHLARLGAEVEWGTRLLEFDEQDTGVVVTLATAHGTERVRAGWLVGCDGAHSTVRAQLGIPLRGESTDTWLVADAQVDTDLDTHAGHWLNGPDGAAMMFPFPEPGKWRLVDTRPEPEDVADPGRLATRFAARLGAAVGRPVGVRPPTWVSRFTIQQRAAPRMNQGRALVAGDAAHVHSPAGGQGLNTGLQDAMNLGWKLADVVRGLAGPELLDTYSAERVPVGSALLESTAEITRFVTGADPGATMDATGRTVVDTANGLSVAYPGSPLTGPDAGRGGPRPGERVAQVTAERAAGPGWRALLDRLGTPGWTLLRIGDGRAPARPSSFGRWADELTVDDAAPAADLDASPGDWLLIRPDGYLAARGGADAAVPLPVGYRAA